VVPLQTPLPSSPNATVVASVVDSLGAAARAWVRGVRVTRPDPWRLAAVLDGAAGGLDAALAAGSANGALVAAAPVLMVALERNVTLAVARRVSTDTGEEHGGEGDTPCKGLPGPKPQGLAWKCWRLWLILLWLCPRQAMNLMALLVDGRAEVTPTTLEVVAGVMEALTNRSSAGQEALTALDMGLALDVLEQVS
jgi:hypothetical protein